MGTEPDFNHVMTVSCAAGPGFLAPCLWMESMLAAAFYGMIFVANDRVLSLLFPKYQRLHPREKRSVRTHIGSLFNAAICLVATTHMLASDYIKLASQDPVHAYPHLLSYYGPAVLGFYVFKLAVQLAHEIQLSNETEVIMNSDGKYNRSASLMPLFLPSLFCVILAYSLETKLFAIYGFFIAIISFQEVFQAVTVLMRLMLKTAAEKSRVYQVVNFSQYVTFPLLRWLSGPYSTYLLYRNFKLFTENIPWLMIAMYAIVMFYENVYTVMFGIQTIIFIIKPDFLKVASAD